MRPTDIITLSVVGVNGSTRNQKAVTEKFDGAGYKLDDNGQRASTEPVLVGLPTEGSQSQPPAFPEEDFKKAAALGAAGIDAMVRIQNEHTAALKQYQQAQGGQNPAARLITSSLKYLEKAHDFSVDKDDPNRFVIKRENVDVNSIAIKGQGTSEERTMWTVTGTAVFG